MTIHSITKGTAGEPGELDGVFASNIPLGNILLNNQTGVYGTLTGWIWMAWNRWSWGISRKWKPARPPFSVPLPTGNPGNTTLKSARSPLTGEDDTKNLVIQVTDPDLLDKTGGIVQGMSGTPILQNGKLVGAVTHVFVNDQHAI